MISALFVEEAGPYFDLPDVEPWTEARDARLCEDPFPVVAHPPCERWGRFWHGSPRRPHQFEFGDDGGKFEKALEMVREHGGVLEHPRDSGAWETFGIEAPPYTGGWIKADEFGGWTCCVDQAHYGHIARKPTWLYAVRAKLPALRWGLSAQRLDPVVLERHGYAVARRRGTVGLIGGKDKKRKRNLTPPEFRDILLAMAWSVYEHA